MSHSRVVAFSFQGLQRHQVSPWGFSLPPSAQSGYCCSKLIYWCQVRSFSGPVEIPTRFRLEHQIDFYSFADI